MNFLSVRRTTHDILSQISQLIRGRTAHGAIGSFALKSGATFIGFTATILLTRLLGASDYGTYAYAFAWVDLLVIPSMLGLNELLVREIAAHKARADERGKTRALLRWSSLTVLTVSASIACVAILVLWLTAGIDSRASYALVLALLSLPLSALTALRQAAMRGFRRVVVGQLPEMLLRPLLVIALTVIAYLYLGGQFNALWAVLIAVTATTASFVWGEFLLKSTALVSSKTGLPVADIRSLLRNALPFLFISGMFVINNRADIIMLGALQDEASVGIYSVVVKGASLVSFVLTAVNMALAPSISGLFATGKAARLAYSVQVGTLTIFIFSLPIALGLVLWGGQFLSIFGDEFRRGYAALVLLSLGQLFNAATGPVGQLLNMTGHERDTAIAIASSAVLNILLNGLFIPVWGIEGAASATVCSTVAWNIGMAILVYRRFGFYTVLGVFTIRRAT